MQVCSFSRVGAASQARRLPAPTLSASLQNAPPRNDHRVKGACCGCSTCFPSLLQARSRCRGSLCQPRLFQNPTSDTLMSPGKTTTGKQTALSASQGMSALLSSQRLFTTAAFPKAAMQLSTQSGLRCEPLHKCLKERRPAGATPLRARGDGSSTSHCSHNQQQRRRAAQPSQHVLTSGL